MNKEQALKFLKWLLSRVPGDKSLVFQLFGEGVYKGKVLQKGKVLINRKDAFDEINKWQAKGAGAFVQINGGNGRGAKAIESVRTVWVDLDGAPLDNVQKAVKEGFPKPAIVVSSSPGKWHVYWNVSGVTVQNFGYIQKSLAGRFDGDMAMSNLDRVMRLPGSLNYKYVEDGQLVQIKHYKPDVCDVHYSELLESPAPVPDESIPDEQLAKLHLDIGTSSNSLVVEGYDKESVADIKELKPGDRTQKIVRIAGSLVNENPDLSADAIKKLLITEVENRTPINTSGPSSDSWENEIFPAVERFVAKRDEQIKESKRDDEAVVADYGDAFEAYGASRDTQALTLTEFSERFVLISSTRQIADLTKSPAQSLMTTDAFKTYAQVFRSEGGNVYNQWVKNRALRRTVDKITYKPFKYTSDKRKVDLQRIVRDVNTGELCFNRYSVPSLVPIASMADDERQQYLKPFLDHIEYLMGSKEKTEVMLNWLAATMQRPDKRVTWAPFIITKYEGVGKGLLAQLMKLLVGGTNYKFITADDFANQNNYNDYLVDCTLLVIDEVYAPRRQDIKNKLNAVITEPEMEINRKFGAKQQTPIYCNTLAFSNHSDALDLKVTDRRFFVTINNALPKDSKYYNKLFNLIEGDTFPAVVMDFLLKRDLRNFNWGECPRVNGDKDKKAMQVANLSDVEELLISLYEAKEGPFAGSVTCKSMIIDYLNNSEHVELAGNALSEIKKWLKCTAISIGRVNALGNKLRHQTFYTFDPKLDYKRDTLIVQAEAKKSLNAVYGSSTMYSVK